MTISDGFNFALGKMAFGLAVIAVIGVVFGILVLIDWIERKRRGWK